MTNNPTIDGVSRELLERLLTDACNENWSDLNELLHAPAACRCRRFGKDNPHWPCPVHSVQVDQHNPTAAMTEAGCQAYMDADGMIGIMHNSSMGHAYVAMRALDPEVASLQSTIAQLEDKLNKAIDLDFQRRETIARLEGKVQELESGRGEPVAWEMDDTAGESGLVQVTNNPSVRDDWVRNELPVCPLFSAPPAPVAAIMVAAIERTRSALAEKNYTMGADECIAIIQEVACLDATAALNAIHVGELDPAERLVLARGNNK